MDKKIEPNVRQNTDEDPSLISAWLHALVSPFFLFQGLADAFLSWLFTRPWRRLCLFLAPLALVAVAVGLIIRGSLLDRDQLQMQYALLAEEELNRINSETSTNADEQPDAAASQLMQRERTSEYADMLFRRLLRLNDRDPKTRFMVASQLASSGRLEQARKLMQEIAPAGAHGFPPAHTWLAIDLLGRNNRSADEQTQLMAHLREASGWNGASGKLLAIYANLLSAEGNRQEALSVMERAAKKDPSLTAALAVMAKKWNVPKIAAEVTAEAVSQLEEKIQSNNASEQDFIQLASLKLAQEQYEAALETCRQGLSQLKGESERLKLLSSEALRLMYRRSIRKTPGGVEVELALLDAAMKEYPSNPALAEEIAMLSEMGVEATPQLKAALENQLVNGKATALAHLLLANQELKGGRIKEAIPHLELTLKHAPSNPIALNNLALALALTDASQLGRAETLIDQAIAINPRNAEHYDTQGEIRLIADRPLDAVASLEKAIAIDSNRQHTRELMVKAYRAAGADDMARVHEKFLAEARTKKAVSSIASEPEDSPAQQPADAAAAEEDQPSEAAP